MRGRGSVGKCRGAEEQGTRSDGERGVGGGEGVGRGVGPEGVGALGCWYEHGGRVGVRGGGAGYIRGR